MKRFMMICLAAILTVRVQAVEEPLPDVDAVLKQILEQAKKEGENEQRFKDSYSYQRSKKTEFKNSRGVVKRTKARVRTNDPINAPSKPIVSALAKISGGSEKAAAPGEKPYEESDFMLGNDLLARFSFTLVGREFTNGRAMLVIDFEPAKKKLSEKNLKEKFLNKTAGRAWVDEKEGVIVNASVHLTEKVNLIGGIVGAVHKFTFNFSRERTIEGVWFTLHQDWRIEGREVIVNRIIEFNEDTADVVRVKPVESPAAEPMR